MTPDGAEHKTAAWTVRDVPLGGSTLSRALQENPQLNGWLLNRPGTADAWRTRVTALQSSAQTSDWLTPLAPAFAATGMAADRLGQAAAHGVVVTTGQQPGLFGGPAYTWSKALSALAMADQLQLLTGVPVAPVFWAASDDADWVEAATTYFATSAGLDIVSLVGPATEGIAMADVPLGPMDHARTALRAAAGSIVHPSILDLVEHAYVPHATIGTAFVQLMRGLLEPLGIAVLDAAHPAVRAAADTHLRLALQHSPAIANALTVRTNAIIAAGFTPQVDVMDDLSLVFHTQTDASGTHRVRSRVPVDSAGKTRREAMRGTLGANVLLRPVIERALLPSVAYHAGPGELGYFAQVSPIAETLGMPVPLVVPRWSGEIIETGAEQRADLLGIDDAMLRDPHAAENHVARQAIAVEVRDAMERLQLVVETQVRAMADTVVGDDTGVSATVVDGLKADLVRRLQRFDRRVTASVKRKEAGLMREVAAVRAALRPMGKSPERVLNLIPMLVRYGPDILTAMYRSANHYAARLVHGK